MGRMYTAQFSGVVVSAQQDFFEINAAATKIVILHAIYLTQSTEVGDAAEEMLQVLIKRGATTSGSGGSAPTAVAMDPQDPAFAGTVEANNTTKATAGTIVTLHSECFNERAGWVYLPTPEMRLFIPPSGRLTVELATTPADALTMNGTIYFEEM